MDLPKDYDLTPIECLEIVLRDIHSELQEINREVTGLSADVGSFDLSKVGELLSEISNHLHRIELNTDQISNIPEEIKLELNLIQDAIEKSANTIEELYFALVRRADSEYHVWFFILTILLGILTIMLATLLYRLW